MITSARTVVATCEAAMTNREIISDYDSAIVGVSDNGAVIYDYDLMVKHLMDTDGMTADEAVEFIDYSTLRSLPYAQEPRPIIMYSLWEF